MRADKKSSLKADKKPPGRSHKRGVVGYSKKTALLEEAITQMNAGKYGRSSAALKELLALDPHNMEARRLFATLHLRLGSLIPARQAFDSLIQEAFERQDYWLAESLLREYLAAGPRCVPYLEKLGWVFQEKGATLEAVAEYGKAIDILLEDPDPERPQYAAELYAKVRELAPASPVAFRLANFFDAQTGELIARPAPAANPSAAPSPASASAATEAPIADTFSSAPPGELPAGLMPWEQGLDEPLVASTPQPAGDSAPSVEQSAAFGALTEEPGQHDTSQAATASPLYQAEASTPDVGHAEPAETAESVLSSFSFLSNTTGVPGATDHASQASSIEPLSGLEMAPEAVTAEPEPPPVTAFSPEPDHSARRSSDFVPTEQRTESPDSLSRPMPWEQVQEASISIDEATDTIQSSPAVPIQESAQQPEVDATKAAESDRAQGPSPGARLEESSRSAPTEAPGASATEEPETSGFSWESVFDSAWKFGDKLIHNMPAFEAPPTPTVELSQPDAADTPGSPTAEAPAPFAPEAPSHATTELTASAAAISPMPWEQVQESVVVIPPAPAEDSTASSFGEKKPEPQSGVQAQEAVPVSIPALTPPSADPPASITAPPPPAAEPEYRLADIGHRDEAASNPSPLQERSASAIPDEAGPDFRFASTEPAASVRLEPVTPVATVSSEQVTPLEDLPGPAEPAWEMRAEADPSSAAEAADEMTIPPAAAVSPAMPAPMEHQPPAFAEPTPLAPPAVAPPAPAAPTQETPAHWSTGELAVQPQRASSKKSKRTGMDPAPTRDMRPAPEPLTFSEDTPGTAAHDVLAAEPAPPPVPEKEEWVRTSESIRFLEPAPTAQLAAPPATTAIEQPQIAPALSPAAAAVDVLFESSGRFTKTATRERIAEPRPRPRLGAKLSRLRIAVLIFIRSCFSTTRAIVTSIVALIALCAALAAVGIGAIGLVWMMLEEAPSPAFQNLTTTPQRTLVDPQKNGYLLLLGFDAPAGMDPVQAGYERKPDTGAAMLAASCVEGEGSGGAASAPGSVAQGWFRSGDPAAQFKSHQETIRTWAGQSGTALARYTRWLKLSFEDWGYGEAITPPCPSILLAHRLYVAEGFVEGPENGVDRLEADMEAWRVALAQAKTLPVKTLALQAIRDDITVASGLLVKSDFDGKSLARLARFLRPLDQVELSIRWPMQSALTVAAKTYEAQLKAERGEDPPLYVAIASALPLPKQRRLNDYAEYYEASYKAAGEGLYASLPKWQHYLRYPADSLVDYVGNPIENIIGLEPLPAWDRYNGLVVDTDAHLRLASLQAWLRRGPPDADLLARIAKAGQKFYDPYTGLPMLVNLKKGVLYSVGHDGKDQDADPQLDVVVMIPGNAPTASSTASSRTGSGTSRGM